MADGRTDTEKDRRIETEKRIDADRERSMEIDNEKRDKPGIKRKTQQRGETSQISGAK